MFAIGLITASALIVLLLGSVHLLYTFYGDKLLPRDASLVASMQQAHLQLTRETTVWRAWIGFNASHSMGAMLFGLIYGYLALVLPTVLFSSIYLQVIGAAMLVGLVLLARRYWFSVPRAGVTLALLLYLAGVGWQLVA